MDQKELIELAQKATGSTKPADLARTTGITSARIADLTSNRRHARNDEVRRLAEIAGLNPLGAIAALEIARAEDEGTKTAWGKVLASVTGKAVMVLLAFSVAVTAIQGSALTTTLVVVLFISLTIIQIYVRLIRELEHNQRVIDWPIVTRLRKRAETPEFA